MSQEKLIDFLNKMSFVLLPMLHIWPRQFVKRLTPPTALNGWSCLKRFSAKTSRNQETQRGGWRARNNKNLLVTASAVIWLFLLRLLHHLLLVSVSGYLFAVTSARIYTSITRSLEALQLICLTGSKSKQAVDTYRKLSTKCA